MADGDDTGSGELPRGYPSGLEVDEVLRDGSTVRFRPIRPSDGPALVDFHDGLSAQSVYRRFFFMHPHLSQGEVERFTTVDYGDRMAYAVFDGRRMVGVGRYERLPVGTEAEVAFVVTDDHQHLGIGTLLLDHLADRARGHGIATFVAQTLSENRDMIGVFRSSGFPVATTTASGTVTLRFPIEDSPDYVAGRASRRSGIRPVAHPPPAPSAPSATPAPPAPPAPPTRDGPR